MVGDERLCTDAGVLLVRHQGQQQPARQGIPRHVHRRAEDRRRAALHVVAAPAVDLAILEPWIERVDGHAAGRDRVQVGAQDQARAIVADPGDRVESAGRDLLAAPLDAPLPQPIDHQAGDRSFALPFLGRQHRIDRWRTDQRLQQLEHAFAGQGLVGHEPPA
jgi:hypothetical protein